MVQHSNTINAKLQLFPIVPLIMSLLFSQQKPIEYWEDKSLNEWNCFEASDQQSSIQIQYNYVPRMWPVLKSLSNLHNLHSSFQTSFRIPLFLHILFEALQVQLRSYECQKQVRQTVLGSRNNERLILPNTSSRALPSINYGLRTDELIAKMYTYIFIIIFQYYR